jgi:hypothetical protein
MEDKVVAVYPQATRLVFTAKTPREAGRMLAEGMEFAAERYNAQVTDWKWGSNGFTLTWSDGVKELYYVMWEAGNGIGRELTKSERSDFDADFFKVLKG